MKDDFLETQKDVEPAPPPAQKDPQEKTVRNPILTLTLTLTVIAVVVSAGLAFIHFITSETIEANKQKKTDQALGEVFPGQEITFSLLQDSEGQTVYTGTNAQGAFHGYAISLTEAGYGGNIEMIVGIDSQSTVTGVQIVSQRETRGFETDGTMQDGFLGRFIGKHLPMEKIDAISGATISSEAVERGVRAAMETAEGLVRTTAD